MIGKLRPYAIFADMVEIATGTVGGLVALGMKVLEND
jgi:hypothetical protein